MNKNKAEKTVELVAAKKHDEDEEGPSSDDREMEDANQVITRS